MKSKHDEWICKLDEKGYREGSEVQVTITAIHETHGAFAELEEGVSGLMHHSIIPPDYSKLLSEGEDILASISRIDRENEKIDLRPTVE